MTATKDAGPDGPARPEGDDSFAIGIDIGGTSIRAGVVDGGGTIVATERTATPRTVRETEDALARMVNGLSAWHRVSAVGLAVAGFISVDRQRVMFAPHLAWRDAPVPARIADRVGLPVVMDHDVNSAAWAEHTLGAAIDARVGLLIALGTGIGAGLVSRGSVFRGGHGVAPELGHLITVPDGRPCPCGKRGCWERYCSGTALAETAVQMAVERPAPALDRLSDGDPARVTGALVAAAAAEGDPAALAAFDDLADWLAVGLAVATDIFDPDVIVIGGGVSRAADMFLPRALARYVHGVTGHGHRPLPQVRASRFGDSAGIIGAALLATGAGPAPGCAGGAPPVR